MNRVFPLSADLYKQVGRVLELSSSKPAQPQTPEALIERARLNVFMENLSKLPGGISFERAEGMIKSFYGKDRVPTEAIDREILGFYEANLLVNQMLEGGFVLNKDSILKIYTSLSKYEEDMTEDEKTGFRINEAYTDDKNLRAQHRTINYAKPENIESELEKLIADVQKIENPIVRAAVFHVEFEAIHPFKDGNGRCGRLLVYAMLGKELSLNGNLVLENFILEGRDKDRYIRAMNVARGVASGDVGELYYEDISKRNGDPEWFVEYFAEIYKLALDKPISIKIDRVI